MELADIAAASAGDGRVDDVLILGYYI